MTNIWNKAISILVGYLNLGLSYLITTVNNSVRANIGLPEGHGGKRMAFKAQNKVNFF